MRDWMLPQAKEEEEKRVLKQEQETARAAAAVKPLTEQTFGDKKQSVFLYGCHSKSQLSAELGEPWGARGDARLAFLPNFVRVFVGDSVQRGGGVPSLVSVPISNNRRTWGVLAELDWGQLCKLRAKWYSDDDEGETPTQVRFPKASRPATR
jgi:hypothetical protein